MPPGSASVFPFHLPLVANSSFTNQSSQFKVYMKVSVVFETTWKFPFHSLRNCPNLFCARQTDDRLGQFFKHQTKVATKTQTERNLKSANDGVWPFLHMGLVFTVGFVPFVFALQLTFGAKTAYLLSLFR